MSRGRRSSTTIAGVLGFEAGLVAGAVLACVVWMATYWSDAAERDARIERCEAALDNATPGDWDP